MSELLAGAGLLAAAGAASAAILLPPGRRRGLAMAAALLLSPVLIAGDQWHTAQITDFRTDEPRLVALLLLAALAIAALASAFRRWPAALPLAIVFALPFRVPLSAGGDTANLLVPLYLVIAGGVAANLLRHRAAPAAGAGAPGREARVGAPAAEPAPASAAAARAAAWLPRALALVVALYAAQALYSEDFSKGLQNACFFYIPFSVAYGLLREVRWDRRLLSAVFVLVAAQALAFVAVGSVEYLTRSLFWNEQVIRSNEFHTYFRVNSVFWDPNIYGRYLALVATIATAALLWTRDSRRLALLAILIGLVWLGLVPTYSQSSYIALLCGLATLAAIRWSPRWTAAALAAFALLAVFVGDIDPSRLNVETSGRANLVSGGLQLFGDRPLHGYGSGSFQAAYRERRENKDAPVSASHTEPVTVLAEQGVVGFLPYLALLAAALLTMGAGVRAGPAARAAVLAAFAALLVHTLAYAGFYEDPITWVLLALGASLALAGAAAPPSSSAAPAPAPIRNTA